MVAALLASFSSVVLVLGDHDQEVTRRQVLQVGSSGPVALSLLASPAAVDEEEAAAPAPIYPPILVVPGLTRGGPQAEGIAVEPAAARIEYDELLEIERVLHCEPDARARLALIDQLIATSPSARVIAVIERLLDRPAGENPDDLRALRIGALARLGRFRDQLNVERRLLDVAHDARRPRPERLSAIDALRCGGAVHESARPTLQRVAADDPDHLVREKARWALGGAS